VPAGKLEKNETPENAAKRELLEETGISLENSSQIQRLNSLYIRKPEVAYVYHVFKVRLDQMPDVHLSDEHQAYIWANSKDIETMALMDGAREALRYYQAMIAKNRAEASEQGWD
jgi:8-oxo-dGTP pyrophosphatase MutT (NUDIX family)